MKRKAIQQACLTKITAGLLIVIAAGYPPALMAGETLARVRTNNTVRCGVTEPLLGFSYKDETGRWRGFNVDFCRAVAVAALGDADKVSFTPLTAPNRFQGLLSRKIDLLAHTTTWTFGREAGIGIDFPGIYFYASQTFAVSSGKAVKRMEDLNGMTICVENRTTFQSTMANTFAKQGIKYTPLVVDSQEELEKAFLSGRCQACTAERTVLTAMQAATPEGAKRFSIMPGGISKEPLAPAVRRSDAEWTTLVRWVLFALIQAEEYGITSANVRTLQKTTTDPEWQWFLNLCGQRAKALGLKPDWVAEVIAAVGNYGEIYERNFGSTSALKIERGLNRLWKHGGLLYAPSFQ